MMRVVSFFVGLLVVSGVALASFLTVVWIDAVKISNRDSEA
jgi:hypothetical protein